jgi:hypothetical protein
MYFVSYKCTPAQVKAVEKKHFWRSFIMAKTAKGNKRTYVHQFIKSNGTVVGNHYRSNPKTSKGRKK